MQRYKLLMISMVVLIPGFLVSYDKKERIYAGSEMGIEEIQEVFGVTTDYTEQQRGEYEREVENKLREYDKLENELNAKSASFTDDRRVLYFDKREEFRNKKNAAYEKLAELKNASARAWKDIKTEMDGFIANLVVYYNKEFSQFR